MVDDNKDLTKGERREKKRKAKKRMRVVGKSVRTILEVIKKRAESLGKDKD